MTTDIVEPLWLNETAVCSIESLAEASGLSPEEIRDLADSGAITPARAGEPASFHLHYIATVRMARRLRDDFELDRHGVALAVTLLQRIQLLEQMLRSLQR